MNLFKQTKQDRDYLALQELLKPVEEQDEATGILSKPKKPEDEESMVTGFFSSMFDRSKQRSSELAQEMQEQQRISEEQEISDYLRRTTISDALYDELKLPNPAYGGLKLVEDRPMTEAELEQYAPLIDLANDIMEETITVKELGAMNRMDQEAFLKSLSDLKVNERSSSFEGDTFEVASSREEFLRDLMKKREADTAKPKDDEASRLKEFLLREETDSTSDGIEPVDTDTIDADGGAAPSGKGLMSPRLDGKDGDLAESYDAMEMDAYLDEFIPEMAQLEGMGGDVVLGDLEPTYSYGITEQKANEYDMRPDQFATMEEFARAFAARYRQEKEDMYPDVFTSDLDKEVERGLQSYLWNRGSFYPGQLRALRAGNLNGFINELKDVISAADRDTPNNQSRPMSGLSKRRAAEANLVGRGIEGYVPIATVETTGTQQRPIFIWRDIQGNELNRYAPQKALHSQSTMGEVEVP
jgi:GH24 family phage-related lysozyme (muramidase)